MFYKQNCLKRGIVHLYRGRGDRKTRREFLKSRAQSHHYVYATQLRKRQKDIFLRSVSVFTNFMWLMNLKFSRGWLERGELSWAVHSFIVEKLHVAHNLIGVVINCLKVHTSEKINNYVVTRAHVVEETCTRSST